VAFTFFLQLKKVNKENRRQASRLPIMALLLRNKELSRLRILLDFILKSLQIQ